VVNNAHLNSMSGTLRKAVALLGVVACVGAAQAQTTLEKAPAAPKTAPAQQPAAPATPPPAQAWAVDCTDGGQGLACKAVQTIVLANTRQLLLSVSVSKPEADKNAAILLRLPLGLFNPAGVTMGVDEAAPEALQIQTCDTEGCYAGAALTPEKIAAMSKGTKLSVIFQDLKKQQIVVPVPLKGFEAALKKL
jgi:invasion protein IalB